MDELWARAALVGAALAVAGVAILVARARFGHRSRTVTGHGLGPGVYLFTSSTCADCGPARKTLIDGLGPEGFDEISWEQDPEAFERTGVDAVPATLVVGDAGVATLYPGQPGKALRQLSP